MQAVFVCGGRGTRLRPAYVGPKSLMPVGSSTLLAQLLATIGVHHRSPAPPVVIVDAADAETPDRLKAVLPSAHVVRQPRPDGVASALLIAEPVLEELVVVALGDLFLDGTFEALPRDPALTFWRRATEAETAKNFGVRATADGFASEVIEKPVKVDGLHCGIGVYVLTRSLISGFRAAPIDPPTGERGITTAIEAAIRAGVRFRLVAFDGYYNNVNADDDVSAVERHLARPVA